MDLAYSYKNFGTDYGSKTTDKMKHTFVFYTPFYFKEL